MKIKRNISKYKSSITSIILLLITILLLNDKCSAQNILSKLKSLPGVIVKKIETLNGFKESYELAVVQPVDHNNPTGPKFTQRVFLSHVDFTKPVVIETHGYDVPWHKRRELSTILDANQIIIEHRYYGNSKPKPLSWEFLTIWQAASDHHRIIEMLKSIYPGKWISTGKSKGGMAALFHKYYYFEDIDASVVFVAPILIGLADMRIPEYIKNITDEQTTKRIQDFQILCLKRHKNLVKLASSKYKNVMFRFGIEATFEWSVIEFPNVFLWGNGDLSKIPDASISDSKLFEYLDHISSLASFSEQSLTYNAPLIYQQSTELGFYGYNTKHLIHYLNSVKNFDPRVFAPKPIDEINFNSDIMKSILEYLQSEADDVIYIYGEKDIYTGAIVNPSNSTNSIQIIAKGSAHKFGIRDLSNSNRSLIKETLREWILR